MYLPPASLKGSMTLGITAPSIKGIFATLIIITFAINDSMLNNSASCVIKLNLILLSVTFYFILR
jgi:hypothetical protein